MKKRLAFLSMAIIFVLSFLSGWTAAEELPKSINLDLSTPREQKNKEEELIDAKYQEILEEVDITEEARQLAENIKDAVTGLKDLTMNVHITQIKGRRQDEMVFKAFLGIDLQRARLEFLRPDAVRGQLVVLNQKDMEMRMFQPVTNQISISTLEDVSKEALSTLNIAEDITSYFDFTQYKIVVLETVDHGDLMEYLLQVESSDNESLQVRVTDDSWLPYEIIVFEDGVLQGKLNFKEIVIDSGFTKEEIEKLPNVKEVWL